jgi:predicted aspartyl protease
MASASFGWSESSAELLGTTVPMRESVGATFYVPGQIEGLGEVEMLVDTGSGYFAINETALDVLRRHGKARYVKTLTGVLANGHEMQVPVYSIARLTIGASCSVNDVHAAVFPGNTRYILGLSALQRIAPFAFSVDPPQLALSNCGVSPVAQLGPAETTAP